MMMQSRRPEGMPSGGQFAVTAHSQPDVAPERSEPDLTEVLESASRLQQLVPDAVLVGGSVVGDLADRFEMVLEAIESEGDWVTNRVTFGKIILGELGGIETGVRQLIRKRPLEVNRVQLPSGNWLQVPTMQETLRIKAFLALRRNQVRDYLDIAALSATMGNQNAADVLNEMDDYYADQRGAGDGVASQVARQLADPLPRDSGVTRNLSTYKGLVAQWQRWTDVVGACRQIAGLMLNDAPQPAESEGDRKP